MKHTRVIRVTYKGEVLGGLAKCFPVPNLRKRCGGRRRAMSDSALVTQRGVLVTRSF